MISVILQYELKDCHPGPNEILVWTFWQWVGNFDESPKPFDDLLCVFRLIVGRRVIDHVHDKAVIDSRHPVEGTDDPLLRWKRTKVVLAISLADYNLLQPTILS